MPLALNIKTPAVPLVYRSMKEENGKPMLGRVRDTLGVVPDRDISVQTDGTVQPKNGGMSVAPSLLKMPYSLIPKRLKHLLPDGEGAKGSNNLRVWKRGVGDFKEASFALKLTMRLDKPTHGLVEPADIMPFAEYEMALQNTRDDWENGE